MGFVLAKRIKQAHPHGFVGAIVEGKRGVGKSSYCIKVMKEVFQTLYDLSETDSWNMALDHILFDMDDVIPFLKQAADSDDMIPVVTWDDAGVHGSNIRWFTNLRQVEMLKALTDTIRTGVTGFLINCPDRSGLLRMLRNYNDFIVEISKIKDYKRYAKGYNLFKLPSGTVRIYKNFQDEYSCYLPKWVYDKYMIERKKYFQKAVDLMEEMQKKLQKRKKKKSEAIA